MQDYSFEGLSSLTYLRLDNNNISTASDKAFSGLTRIRYIDLDRNPTSPFNTVAPLKSLEHVYIWYYNPEYLTPEPFQQLPELTLIQIYYVQFKCDCSKQWLSRLSNFGIAINIVGSTATRIRSWKPNKCKHMLTFPVEAIPASTTRLLVAEKNGFELTLGINAIVHVKLDTAIRPNLIHALILTNVETIQRVNKLVLTRLAPIFVDAWVDTS